MKDKITIVIPCKNEQNYIAHLLNDLKNQKNINGVKIYIADASTDSTRNVIQENSKNLDVTIIDGGPVSFAKNNGARLATTPYILFIDADVRFFSNTVIQDTVELLEQKDLDLIGLNIKCYDDSEIEENRLEDVRYMEEFDYRRFGIPRLTYENLRKFTM
jgi:glycosyltransferase involved in cell wall biosynthesis